MKKLPNPSISGAGCRALRRCDGRKNRFRRVSVHAALSRIMATRHDGPHQKQLAPEQADELIANLPSGNGALASQIVRCCWPRRLRKSSSDFFEQRHAIPGKPEIFAR